MKSEVTNGAGDPVILIENANGSNVRCNLCNSKRDDASTYIRFGATGMPIGVKCAQALAAVLDTIPRS